MSDSAVLDSMALSREPLTWGVCVWCLCGSAAELDGKEFLDFVSEVLCELRYHGALDYVACDSWVLRMFGDLGRCYTG